MKNFSVYLAASVDGYIAEADGSVAWLDAFEGEGSEDAKNLGNTSDQNPYGYAPFYETISTLVFGRTTFDQVLSFDVSWPYAGKQTLVMTHRDPPDVSIDGVSFVSRSAEDIAAGLEGSKGDVWLIGGADVIGHSWMRGVWTQSKSSSCRCFWGAESQPFPGTDWAPVRLWNYLVRPASTAVSSGCSTPPNK
jgi:dihydrofolate reductase